MNFSRIDRQTRAAGFTIAELMVATMLVGAVGIVLFSTMVSAMRLSTQNVVLNVSGGRTRHLADRIGEVVRFAQDTPVLINANGSVATGNIADGIEVKNSVDGPYVIKNANGQADAEIPADAKVFTVEYSPAADVAPPQVGDYLAINLSKRPELEIVAVTAVGGGDTLSKVKITTRQTLGEVAKPGSYEVTAYRFRKEAFIFVKNGSAWDLRHYGIVSGGMNFDDPSKYTVLGNGFQRLGGQPWFVATTTATGTRSVGLRAVARSSNHTEYVESISDRTTLTSMPMEVILWNYQMPAPPES